MCSEGGEDHGVGDAARVRGITMRVMRVMSSWIERNTEVIIYGRGQCKGGRSDKKIVCIQNLSHLVNRMLCLSPLSPSALIH